MDAHPYDHFYVWAVYSEDPLKPMAIESLWGTEKMALKHAEQLNEKDRKEFQLRESQERLVTTITADGPLDRCLGPKIFIPRWFVMEAPVFTKKYSITEEKP